MLPTNSDPRAYWRTLLILGRTSNLPTVWSNCVAGWLLGGGGNWGNLGFLFVGGTLLYIGGMFLNDAFDAVFDRQYRHERPIPSGAISLPEVWAWGVAWLGLGLGCLAFPGAGTFGLGLALVAAILIYDAFHKLVSFSPVLMALCRVLLYLVASSTAVRGVTGLALWSALALGAYIVGLSYLARRESTGRGWQQWPLLLLALPYLLAFLVNGSGYVFAATASALILLAWTSRSLWFSYRATNRNVGRSVAGLLAGIVLVDLLAVGGEACLLFALFFGMALFFQRFIPAT
ncbi:MAG TPA: UbiA family prenyltransferase [Verrucomicrobiae bacterium]|nr:UbiA family prenyltransferase [Verrucomicrobiae bacterium]